MLGTRCVVSLPLCYNSMENLDKKFDKMLSLQVLDKSKAIAHILQEVRGAWVWLTLCLERLMEKSNL